MITLTPWKMITSSTLENDNILSCYHLVLSFILCCHLMLSFLMLSFGVIIWCYYLFNVIIWCYHFSQFANVIIFVLSFFLEQHGCYHLCYHLMLSFFVIISPLFSFSWKCDTLVERGTNFNENKKKTWYSITILPRSCPFSLTVPILLFSLDLF
jgi:hypothetical protein